jgi:hypothetical protein
MMQYNGPTAELCAGAKPRPELLPAPLVHPDLASATALAVADEHRSALGVEIVLGERERLLDPQPGAPQDDDPRAQPEAVAVVRGVAHHRDDLIHTRRVGRVRRPLLRGGRPAW